MNAEERIEKLERELGRAKRRTRVLLAGFAVVAALAVWAIGTLTPTAEAQQAGNPQTSGATELREEVLRGIEKGGQEPYTMGRRLSNRAANGDLAAAQLLLAYIDGGSVELVRLPGTDSKSN